MKVVVKWADGAMVVGEPGSGHTVVMNVPRDLGGRNPGPRPIEMLIILGKGGCSGHEVMSMLKKLCQKVVDCGVGMAAGRAMSPAKRCVTNISYNEQHSSKVLAPAPGLAYSSPPDSRRQS